APRKPSVTTARSGSIAAPSESPKEAFLFLRGGHQASSAAGSRKTGRVKHVGGALVGILVGSADEDRLPAHGDRISELITARAIGGGQLLLRRPGAGV